jgi:hypothetical protein
VESEGRARAAQQASADLELSLEPHVVMIGEGDSVSFATPGAFEERGSRALTRLAAMNSNRKGRIACEIFEQSPCPIP